MRLLPLLLVLSLVSPLATGCASLGGAGLERPTASVRGVEVAGVDADGFRLELDLDVENPNAAAIPLTGTRWAVSLAGAEAVEGTVAPRDPDGGGAVTLPARGSTGVVVPVSLGWERLAELGSALAASGGRVPYRVDASLSGKAAAGDLLGGLLGGVRIPLSYEGELDLAALLRDPAVLRSPAARALAKELLGGLLRF